MGMLPWRRRWFRVISHGLIISLLLASGLEIAIRRVDLPPDLLRPSAATPVILDRNGRIIAELGNKDARLSKPITLDEINPMVITATLAAEDHRFHSHAGIDLFATASALARNLKAGRLVSGASTLTQQLIKLEAGNTRRGWSAKIHENLASLRLEREWSKSAILERYLNRVEYGNHLRGIEAASRGYFGKPARDLTLPEAVYLAGLPQSPTRFNPRSHPDRAKMRFHQIVGKLQRLGWLDAAQLAGLASPPALVPPETRPPSAPHFVARLRQRGIPLLGEIRTTLDLDLQRQVDAILARHLRRLAPAGAGNAAAVVIDHRDGSIRAWCGSGNWDSRVGQIDGVTRPRSCGSTLKPFLYLRALDRRILTAATLLPDTPDAIRAEYVDYDPRNYDDRFWGPVRVREALANSLNVPAVVTLARVGARDTYDFLQRSGIPLARSLDEYGAGLILGNAEVRMLDLAAAYGAFAHQGIFIRPRFTEDDPKRDIVVSSPEAAAVIADVLSDNNARRKTFGPTSPLAFDGIRIACKTGTSSGFRDAWTFGVTGRHVVAVWVGNLSGRPMREIASITGPAPIWREIVDLLLPGDGGLPAPDPALKLEKTQVCPLTGLRPSQLGPQSVSELFIRGTSPVVDSSSFFFEENGETRISLPPEYAIWCRSSHNFLGAVAKTSEPLVIVNPHPNSRFLIDSSIPDRRQKIEFIAVGGGASPIQWEINGEPIVSHGDNGSVFWPPRRGQHRLTALQGTARSEVTFQVD